MKKAISIPESISARNEYKRKFSAGEMYRSFMMIPSSAARMIRNRRKKLVDNEFIERLQLAVTEVNGCAACSYAHTYMALKQGMSNEEITSFLSGDGSFVKQDEAKAIVFAQSFAESRGFPKQKAYDAIQQEYGADKAEIILAAVRIMLVGNIYGLPYSAFQSRLKGKPYTDSSVRYELGMQAAGFLFLPIAMIHGMLRSTLGLYTLRFDENSDEVPDR